MVELYFIIGAEILAFRIAKMNMIFSIVEFLNFSFIFSVSIFSLMFWFRTRDNYIKLCLRMILTTLLFHLLIVVQLYFTTVTLAYPGVYFRQSGYLRSLGIIGGFLELLLVFSIVLFSSFYFLDHLHIRSVRKVRIINLFLNVLFLILTALFLAVSLQRIGWEVVAYYVQYRIFPFAALFIGAYGLLAWYMRGKTDVQEHKNQMAMIARNLAITFPFALIDIALLNKSPVRLTFVALTPFFFHVFFHLSRYYYLNYESVPTDEELLPNMMNLGLTEREQEIALLIVRGTNYNDIGESLFISVNTVKTHVKNIYRKTGVSNRTQLNYKLRTPSPSS